MKKVLSLVLALALVLGSFAPAFAAENPYAEQGEFLKELGVFKGDENGLRLDDELKRAELFTLISRLMGEEEEAKSYPIKGSLVFSDVEGHWADSIIGWAFANGLTAGYPDGTVKPEKIATVQETQLFLLRALGYDSVEWNDVPAKAKELGIMGDIEVEGNATRGLLAALTVNTLDTAKADGTETLAETLEIAMPRYIVAYYAPEAITVIEGGEITLPETVLAELDNGVIIAVPVVWGTYDTATAGEFTVVGEAENVGEVELALTVTAATIESVEEVAAVTVTEGETIVLPETVEATYNNGTTGNVQVTWTETEYVVGENTVVGTIEGYEAGVTATVTVEVLELAIESVTSNYALNQFDITLNKAIDTDTVKVTAVAAAADTFKVYDASGNLVNLVVTFNEEGTEANVQMGSTFAQRADLRIVLNGVEAAAGNAEFDAYEYDFEIRDINEPAVTKVEATSSKTIKVTFSEEINQADNVSKVWSNIFVDGKKAVGNFKQSTANINVWTLTLNSSLAVGSHTVEISSFADASGFPMDSFTGAVSIVEDTTAPTVVAVNVLAKNKVQVVFSEPVVITAGTVDIGTESFAMNIGTQVDDVTFNFTLGALNNLTARSTYGEILTYTSITDFEGNASTSDGIDFEFTAPVDKEKPSVAITLESDNKLTVDFSEIVIGGDVLANYTLLNADGGTVKAGADAITPDASDDTVFEVVFNAISSVDPAQYSVKIENITDASVIGNAMGTVTYSFTTNDANAPQIVGSPTVVAADTVRIAFTEAMDVSTLTDATNYLFNDGATVVFLSDVTDYAIVVASDAKSVDITIPGVDTVDDEVAVLDVKDASGKRIASGDFNSLAAVITAPTFTEADIASIEATGLRTLVITATSNFAVVDPNAFIIEDNNDPSNDIYVVNAEIDADNSMKVILTLNADLSAIAQSNATDIKVDVTGTTVTDINGTALAIGIRPTVDDKIVPLADDEITTADDTTFTVALSEQLMDGAGAEIAGAALDLSGNIIVLVNGSLATPAAVVYNPATDSIDVTFGAAQAVDTVISIKYFTGQGLTDDALNELTSFDLEYTVK